MKKKKDPFFPPSSHTMVYQAPEETVIISSNNSEGFEILGGKLPIQRMIPKKLAGIVPSAN
jgi:hypothetical protein